MSGHLHSNDRTYDLYGILRYFVKVLSMVSRDLYVRHLALNVHLRTSQEALRLYNNIDSSKRGMTRYERPSDGSSRIFVFWSD